MTDEQWMSLAMKAARDGIAAGQTPFGACIVRGGKLIVAVHNVVLAATDITAHAEVNAIRQACGVLQSVDLSSCVIYSTCEPCPMCFAACHWAKLDRIVYAAEIADAKVAGFNEMPLSNQQMKQQGQSPIQIVPNILRDEGRKLFAEWLATPGHRVY